MRTRFTNLWLLAVVWLFAAAGAWAQSAVSVGAQVTAESDIVSGQPYVLYYSGNNNSGYCKISETQLLAANNDGTPTEASVFYFISDGNGAWNIKSRWNGYYLPTFTAKGTPYTPTASASDAGAFVLNFQSDGKIAPSNNGYSFNRSSGVLHPWDSGTTAANQFIIYRVEDTAVPVGTQVTDASAIDAAKPYVLQYVGNNAAYVQDATTSYNVNVSNASLRSSLFYFSNATGSGTLRNLQTGRYFPAVSTTNYLASADSSNAGSFYLNMSDGQIIPTDASSSFYMSRSSNKLQGWASNSNSNFKIYSVGHSTTALSSFTNLDMTVSSEAATSLSVGTWYVMYNRGRSGYLYENTSTGTLSNTSTAPSGDAPTHANYLVRIVHSTTEGKYYLQNGLGNYFAAFPDNTAVSTSAFASEEVSIGTIASTAGHFYLTSSTNGIVLDCQQNGNPVVGYGTTIPTSVGGNNDWAFYPVTLDASWTPTASEVYTVNNTNTDRGALMYYPTGSEKYIWSSGKSGTFDETDANCQWVFYPTGTDDQYYLYNVGAGKFAVPSGVAQSSANSWYFSPDAVAVTLENNGDGTYKIKMAVDPVSGTNAAYMAVSNNYTGPIINYNDAGSNFTITQVAGADQSTAVAAAVAKLVNKQTALTNYPQTSGWYVLQIKSKNGAASYANRYLYQASSLYSNLYPLTFTGGVAVEPAITDPTFFTYIDHTSWDNNTWQLPDGRYLVDNGSNKFPTLSTTAGNVIAGYSNGNYFKTSNNYYADPYNDGNSYYIGETTTMRTAYTVYPIDLTTAGLTAWQVTINNGSSSTMLTCTRSDVVGNTSVYTGGWFFLPTGTTPTSSNFTLDGMTSCTVNDTTKTITAIFDPSICLLADDVTVIQGHQTTGKGNTMQALLRVKATPFATMTPKAVSVTLTNYDQLDSVAVYVTTDDELHAESAFPVKIGDAAVTGDSMTITTSSATALTAGTTYYLWITGDVKSTATEWGTIDAAITNIAYTSTNGDKALDVTSIGNPDGVMRIYKQQTFLWTPSKAAGKYYRIPTMITTNDGGIVALADYRHDHPYDLGKNASNNGTGNHWIDVVSRRSADGGLTWQDEVVVAAGDGTNTASCGYGDPAIVKDADGTLHCMMAAGNTSYTNGMLHMGYSKSTNGGATWSAVTDIYSNINKSGLDITSAFTTAGTGVTFSNGRMAFAMLGKVSGTTNIYPLYSDDNGATWIVSPKVAYAGGDESKFEIMNDSSLLVSVRKGNYNGTANRGHNRTTGDASGTGISSWGIAADWTDMNANGCNADIMYYSRTTDGAQDVMFHTLTKSYGATGVYRRDLRLYMSLDQGATWTEAFSLQPGSAAYSSMQKLPNGDLAIIFEDGTVGNRDQQDCYAINYVVISKELLEEKINELVENEIAELAPEVKVVYGNTAPTTYGDFDSTNDWRQSWTSKVATGYNDLAGVTLSSSYSGALNQFSNIYSTNVLAVKVSATGATDDITITAPSGYIIKSYTLKARSYNSGKNYTLTSGSTTITTGIGSWSTFTISDINTSSATFTITTNQDQTNYLCISDFVITVAPEDAPTTSTFYLKNASTGTTLQTKTVPYGTSLSDVLTYTDQSGSLSPLVSYDLMYDFSSNAYTANYTVQTSSVASPTWYYARLRNTKFMSYDPMAETLSGYGHPVSSQMTTFGDEYLWTFVGDPYDCVKIYNKSVGTTQPLATITKADGEYLRFAGNDTTTFQPYYFDGGLVFRLNGQTAYLNDVKNGIGRWNSAWGADDPGSKMYLTAETDVEELVSYVPDALTNYVSKYLTGNIIGAVGDFSNSTALSNAQGMYQTAVDAGSSCTVAYYLQLLLNFIKPNLVQPSTGNYRLLNVSTGKYLGFNEAFHVRGYTAANGTNDNEGYSETGQTLSTVWHVDVNDEGTTAAPVITNSGYYLDAVTSLDGTSACNLVLSAYPVSYGLGVNGEGAVYSNGDNVSASSWSNLYTDAAHWKLIPASQTDITITGNVLGGKSYATLYVPFDCTINTENTKAFTLVQENVDDDKAQAYLSELAAYGEVIPAGTPVVIINSVADTELAFTPCDDNTVTAPEGNVICGTYKKVLFDSDTERNRTNTLIFGRSKTSTMAGFYYPSSSVTKLNANRCYLIAPASGNAMGFALFFDDEESPVTGVNALEHGAVAPAAVYDLQGRRVAVPQKGGVYIVNGRKVMR